MKVPFSERTKQAIRRVLRRAAVLVILAYYVAIGSFLVFVSYVVNLVDVKLVVSLWISEVPLAFILSYFLERRRTKVQDSVEHLRALKEFAHLKVHKFSSLFIPWYYVENVATKCAYEAPEYFVTLVSDDVIELVGHGTEKEMLDYFVTNHINLEKRYPTPGELT